MNTLFTLAQTKRVGVGLAFIIFPLIFVFAFAVHPDLLHPRLLGPEELALRAHGNDLLQLAHALVTLNTALLVAAALHLMGVLERHSSGWAGLVGGAIAIVGALTLAADKGALCLTMSALDTLPESVFAQTLPGVSAIFMKQGWLVLLWGIVCLPIGFAIQAVALLKARALPRWQGGLFLIAVLLIAVPDGLEIVNLSASVMLAVSLVPYGLKIMMQAVHGTALSSGTSSLRLVETPSSQEARD